MKDPTLKILRDAERQLREYQERLNADARAVRAAYAEQHLDYGNHVLEFCLELCDRNLAAIDALKATADELEHTLSDCCPQCTRKINRDGLCVYCDPNTDLRTIT